MAQQFGIIGLEVMGRNIALNIERNGFPIAVYNRTTSKTDDFVDRLAKGKKVVGAKTVQEFCAALDRPRRILIMVKAGKPVDMVIDELKPFLQPGDIVIDGGNSHFTDTERREQALRPTGIRFFGMGVSGGEEGALWGPSLMPGGDEESYKHLEPILQKIAAKTSDDGPCVTYVGDRGAGHFVKMVHNGIEYGDMQLIAEAYDLMKNVAGLNNRQLKEVFTTWNQGDLKSFLIEITAQVIDFPDPDDASRSLVDMILDKAGQKGTGKWTTQSALDLGVPIPTITAAVDARGLSALKQERLAATKLLSGPQPTVLKGKIQEFIDDVRDALYCSKICSYAQGMALLAVANKEFNYRIHLDEIARIWKAGCIIRATLLDEIKTAFKQDPALVNLLRNERFRASIAKGQAAWRRVLASAIGTGIATPAFGASLAYYDSYRRERVPANLIQAQRDFFGAHTYERIDKPGTFHTGWGANAADAKPADSHAQDMAKKA